jgi:p-aminobenzoyl-glutamate transporter AbgT
MMKMMKMKMKMKMMMKMCCSFHSDYRTVIPALLKVACLRRVGLIQAVLTHATNNIWTKCELFALTKLNIYTTNYQNISHRSRNSSAEEGNMKKKSMKLRLVKTL